MKSHDEDIDRLIASFLAGEASADEIAFLQEWKSRSEDNRRYFQHLELIFEHATTIIPGEDFDTNVAWEKVRKKLPSKDKPVAFFPSLNGPMLLRLAAGLALFLTVAVFVYRFGNTSDSQSVRIASAQKMLSDTLPDGSGVFLNRQTTLEIVYDPQVNKLTADLVGEAYFDISHNREKVFVVEAGGALIKDIGTAFNVRAYPDSDTIEVFVEEGEVMFYTTENPGISLKANTRGVYNKNTRTFAIADAAPNITSYKSRVFTFNNQSLATVVKKLNEVYDSRIQIDNNLRDCRITVSFNDESMDEIAEIIAETLELSLSKSSNIIKLSGDGCTEADVQ